MDAHAWSERFMHQFVPALLLHAHSPVDVLHAVHLFKSGRQRRNCLLELDQRSPCWVSVQCTLCTRTDDSEHDDRC